MSGDDIMVNNYNINRIMDDYNRKKRYEQKIEMQEFQRKNCINCKNKKTSKCHITRDLNNKLVCAFYED